MDMAAYGDKEEAQTVVKAEQESEESIDPNIKPENDERPADVRVVEKKGRRGRRPANPFSLEAEVEKTADEVLSEDFEEVEVKKPTNPLIISLIVSNVMKYLTSHDLKKCRLVSKTWNTCAVPFLKLNHPPVIFRVPKEIFKFSQLMLETRDVPYTSFKLRSRFTPRFENYFKTFGHAIQHIEISSKTLKNWIDFKYVCTVLQWMQNLKSLRLVNIDFPNPVAGAVSDAATLASVPVVLNHIETLEFHGWFFTWLYDRGPLDMLAQQCIFNIYSIAPMTKNLELNILRSKIIPNFLVGIGQLRRLEKLSIKSLKESDLIHLVQGSANIPKVKSLSIREIKLDANGELLLQVMDIYAGSLEYLNIRAHTTRELMAVKFLQMRSLKELRLDILDLASNLITFDPLNLRLKPGEDPFPVLTKLVISQPVLKGLSLAGFHSPTVVEVSLKLSLGPMSIYRNAAQDDNEPIENPMYDAAQAQVVALLPEMFPAMKKLKVEEIRCSALRILFRTSTQLEALEISHLSSRYGVLMAVGLNKALTGLEHPALISTMLDLHPRDMRVVRFIKAISPDSIRNMKKLKVLIFNGTQCIDESAVNLALLRMQPLDALVFRAQCVCFEDVWLAALSRRHKMVQISAPQINRMAEI